MRVYFLWSIWLDVQLQIIRRSHKPWMADTTDVILFFIFCLQVTFINTNTHSICMQRDREHQKSFFSIISWTWFFMSNSRNILYLIISPISQHHPIQNLKYKWTSLCKSLALGETAQRILFSSRTFSCNRLKHGRKEKERSKSRSKFPPLPCYPFQNLCHHHPSHVAGSLHGSAAPAAA